MAESTENAPAGEEAGLWSTFIAHTQTCPTCRGTGVNCGEAAELVAAWRQARAAA
ncbi:hypothetical protein [Streptomyces sp. NPDC054887]